MVEKNFFYLQRFNSVVYRRYNDFVSLHELLLARFPYRLIPKLPPKKIVGGKVFVSFFVYSIMVDPMNFNIEGNKDNTSMKVN